MNQRYILEPYTGQKSRHFCPKCNDKKSFTKYIDLDTGNYLSDEVGRCNHQLKCGYHFTPKQFLSENKDFIFDTIINTERLAEIQKELSKPKGLHSMDLVNKARSNNSNFVQFLYSKFDKNKVDEVAELYQLGISKHFNGNSVVFWQIDRFNAVHYGKVMQYNQSTGKRLKMPFPHITNVHTILKDETAKYSQHLFGEHLINLHPDKHILIVESEKTALIGAIVLPQFNWIACCGVGNLNADRLKNIIHYRDHNKIKLVPDLDALDKWSEKSNSLGIPMLTSFTANATEEDIQNGLDLADIILRDLK